MTWIECHGDLTLFRMSWMHRQECLQLDSVHSSLRVANDTCSKHLRQRSRWNIFPSSRLNLPTSVTVQPVSACFFHNPNSHPPILLCVIQVFSIAHLFVGSCTYIRLVPGICELHSNHFCFLNFTIQEILHNSRSHG